MIKFFRKYNKTLLAIFGVALLVFWLGGTALQEMISVSATGTVVANSRLGEITYGDQTQMQQVGDLVALMGVNWRDPLRMGGPPLDVNDVILLQREAQELKLEGRPSGVASEFSTPEGDAILVQLARSRGVRKDVLLDAYARIKSVLHTARVAGGVTVPSEAEVRMLARRVLEKVKIHATVLPASAFEREGIEFTEEELTAQFEAHRDEVAGTGLDFGYTLGDAVKIEYIQIDPEQVEKDLRVDKGALRKEARDFWEDSKESMLFLRPPSEIDDASDETPDDEAQEPASDESDDAPDAETSSADEPEGDGDGRGGPRADAQVAEPKIITDPTAQEPADDEPVQAFFESWDEARETAMEEIKRQRAARAVQKIQDWFLGQLSEPWLGVTKGEDGYKIPPETVTRDGYFERLLGRMPATISYPDAISVNRTDFVTARTIRDVEGLGFARGRRFGMNTLAFRVQGLSEIPETADDRSTYLALYQPSMRVVTNSANQQSFMFRVVEVRQSRPAETLDEVRDRVVKDLRTVRGYEAAMARAELLADMVGEGGTLNEAYEASVDLKDLSSKGVKFQEPGAFARLRQSEASRGVSDVERVFVSGGLGFINSEVADQIFALADTPSPRAVFELTERATVLVVEWQETEPARIDAYEALRSVLVGQLTRARTVAARRDWCDPQQIRARATTW